MKAARLRLVSAFAALAVLVAAAVSACNDEKSFASPAIDGELAMKYAQSNFDLGPKVFRTEGAKKSAEWIAEQARMIPGFDKAGRVRIPPSTHGECNVEITFDGKTDDFISPEPTTARRESAPCSRPPTPSQNTRRNRSSPAPSASSSSTARRRFTSTPRPTASSAAAPMWTCSARQAT